MRSAVIVLVAATCLGGQPWASMAQTTQPAEDAAADQPATQPSPRAPAPDAALRGPIYLPLRYDDDFSYLDGPPGSYKTDFFDPIKNIRLGEDWRLSLGGEARLRMEAETNRNFGSRDPSQDTFLLHRYLLHANLKHRSLFRLYLEGIDANVDDRNLSEQPGMENRFDINQAFFDLRVLGEETPLTLRAGRQQLSYGRERFVGKSDWTNAPRRFDGFKLMHRGSQLDVDAFYVKPIIFMTQQFVNTAEPPIDEGLNRKPDGYREEGHFYGVYSTYKGIPRHLIDVYFLGLNDDGRMMNPNGRLGDQSIYTIGSRFAGGAGGFDYDIEAAGQWGKWAGDDVKAWLFGGEAGYTLLNVPWTPRLALGLDYGSGDDTPRDNTVETLNQLFPTGHSFLGFIDLVGRQNIMAPSAILAIKPHKDVTARLAYYHFWLNSDRDALYNKSGNPVRRNVSGSSGNDVGDELDITLSWKIDVHSNLLVGYSYFWPNHFISTTGPSRDASLFYLQYQFRF